MCAARMERIGELLADTNHLTSSVAAKYQVVWSHSHRESYDISLKVRYHYLKLKLAKIIAKPNPKL